MTGSKRTLADALSAPPRTDGGNAFPRATMDIAGMSRRDWFAGQALARILASPHIADHAGMNTTDEQFVANLACRAYAFADAMLIARRKTP